VFRIGGASRSKAMSPAGKDGV